MGKTDITRFKALLAKLEALGLPTTTDVDGSQVAYVTNDDLPRAVTLEDFFVGSPNNRHTFAANLTLLEHPGDPALYALFQQLRARPDVHDVWVGVIHIGYHATTLDQDWAYSDTLYIVTTARPEDIAPEAFQTGEELDETVVGTGWFGKYFPTQIWKIDYEDTFIREGLLPPPPGYTIYMLWWD